MQTSNEYLNQVVEEQAEVVRQLQARAVRKPAASAGSDHEEESWSERGRDTSRPVGYRITGFWRWKTVVVQPNFYAVHTRRGHSEPLHIGLGVSFPYNPFTDAFLVVPAVMQTL